MPHFLAATKQLYEWFITSVCPSVTLFWLCSHHRIIMKFSGVITSDRSDVHAKGQGQRSKVKVTEVTTQLNPKHYSYQYPSYLGVLDMCLILSLYLHVLSLSVGFRYHYLWYCLHVYLLIVCMYYFICGFYVSLSFDIVYMYIHLCIYLLKVGD